MNSRTDSSLPNWVPEGAMRYLKHTEEGCSIRDLARVAGCHASTVLRQIRKVEMRRDDPLVDAALQALASHILPTVKARTSIGSVASTDDLSSSDMDEKTLNSQTLAQEASRILRRLCETGAVLAVAEGMEKAVVVRDDRSGASTRTGVVDCKIAQAMALKDWISCDKPGRISRYRITASGRTALGRMLAEAENLARARQESGFAEAPAAFAGPGSSAVATAETDNRRARYCAAESPLTGLARRRDRDGQPFLEEGLVAAGERLREDFELAQMGPRVTQNWERFLTGNEGRGTPGDGGSGMVARDRVRRALDDLGPGLSDVAMRCCCMLEGLEQTEKRMGWSARSGKIVLRIALQRLKRHYEEQSEQDRLIG
ncbi:DUF6456 domain-containing protein [Primorskyibacter sp. S87]|uniref:DUF6456 domain-containing protein n=1 Tax=Primorskyibacter sp. S87 TaxID=3415126 RepID=UPI003C7AB81F